MEINIKSPRIITSFKTEKIYPELEKLIVTPSEEVQEFKSDKYGYDTVTVKAVETEEITITPCTEQQSFNGLYRSVTVKAIDMNEIIDEKNIAIDNILVSSNTKELLIAYNDTVLDINFNRENKDLIIDNNVEGLDFNINKNMELEAIY